MKVGDYVRTDNGISKCIEIDKNNGDYIFDKSIFYELDGLKTHILYKYYLQDEIDDGMTISPNIIDLIEVGDIVNYEQLNGGVVLNEKDDSIDTWSILPNSLKNEDIKSVITKEQLKNNMYIIGE